MKSKMLLSFALFAFNFGTVKAAEIGDHIKATLLEHVEAVQQFTEGGQSRIAALDSIIQLGSMDGKYIVNGQLGFSAITNPDSSTTPGAGYLGGLFVRLDPFVRRYVKVPGQWEFLKAIEFGGSYNYDFREHHAYLAFSLGLAFSLTPKQ